METNREKDLVIEKKQSPRKWNSVHSTGRSGPCCWCRKPTLNSIITEGSYELRNVFFCSDTCVDKFKDSVRKW